MISNKQDFLKFIKGAGVGLYGTPATGQTVKFQYTTNIATAATNDTAGALTFAHDATNGLSAIYANGELVSSAIQKVEVAAATGNKHGGKTITVTYIVANTGVADTTVFDVIDEAGLEAYFANSKTIALDSSSFEVKIKADGGLAVDNANGLYVDIADLFGVDNETIGFDEQNKLKTLVKLAYAQSGLEGEPAIQLQNANDEAFSEVTVADLIADGIVESTSYDAATNILTINWKGGAVTTINMAAIIDINDVFIAADSSNLLTATNDTSVIRLGTTAKLRNAVALAESAIQGVEKLDVTGAGDYVSLTVAPKTGDASTIQISVDDTAAKNKFVDVDASIDRLDTSVNLINVKDEEQDSSIDRLDSSVSAIEAAIEAMDATESDNVLDGSIAITVTQEDGLVTGVDLTATKSTVTFDGENINLSATNGLLVADAIPAIKSYVDAKSGALDSSVTGKDVNEFVIVNTVQTDGALSAENVTVVYGDYADENQAQGIATTGATKTYIDTEIADAVAALDSSVTGVDSSSFVTVNTVQTDGELSAENVTVQYATVSATPGNVTVSQNGIVKGDVLEAAIEGALTWTVLS